MKKKYITPVTNVFPVQLQSHLMDYSVRDYENKGPQNVGLGTDANED